MLTTLEQINEKLALMDASLARAIESKDTKDVYDFNVNQTILHYAIYGNYNGKSECCHF
jgi:hypothetical protein